MKHSEIIELLENAFNKNKPLAAADAVFSMDLQLIGQGGVLDSLDGVLFLDTVDDLFSEKLGYHFEIMSDEAFELQDSPFRTVETLVAYITEKIEAVEEEM